MNIIEFVAKKTFVIIVQLHLYVPYPRNFPIQYQLKKSALGVLTTLTSMNPLTKRLLLQDFNFYRSYVYKFQKKLIDESLTLSFNLIILLGSAFQHSKQLRDMPKWKYFFYQYLYESTFKIQSYPISSLLLLCFSFSNSLLLQSLPKLTASPRSSLSDQQSQNILRINDPCSIKTKGLIIEKLTKSCFS